jgi:hypothetical protein
VTALNIRFGGTPACASPGPLVLIFLVFLILAFFSYFLLVSFSFSFLSPFASSSPHSSSSSSSPHSSFVSSSLFSSERETTYTNFTWKWPNSGPESYILKAFGKVINLTNWCRSAGQDDLHNLTRSMLHRELPTGAAAYIRVRHLVSCGHALRNGLWQPPLRTHQGTFSVSILLSSLELSDTHVYVP